MKRESNSGGNAGGNENDFGCNRGCNCERKTAKIKKTDRKGRRRLRPGMPSADMHACRLQASLTRSARHMCTGIPLREAHGTGSNPKPTHPKERKNGIPIWDAAFLWRCRPDLNRRITVLQTGALPLGYCTKFSYLNIITKFFCFVNRKNVFYQKNKDEKSLTLKINSSIINA